LEAALIVGIVAALRCTCSPGTCRSANRRAWRRWSPPSRSAWSPQNLAQL